MSRNKDKIEKLLERVAAGGLDDLTPEQIYLADEQRPNADPFDALICAAARHLDLPLLTRDGDIAASKLVSVIW